MHRTLRCDAVAATTRRWFGQSRKKKKTQQAWDGAPVTETFNKGQVSQKTQTWATEDEQGRIAAEKQAVMRKSWERDQQTRMERRDPSVRMQSREFADNDEADVVSPALARLHSRRGGGVGSFDVDLPRVSAEQAASVARMRSGLDVQPQTFPQQQVLTGQEEAEAEVDKGGTAEPEGQPREEAQFGGSASAAAAGAAADKGEEESALPDDADLEDIPGSERDKFVDSEIMKMEARIIKAATRKEARRSLLAVTCPSRSMFEHNKKLVPPPPVLNNILVPAAMEVGQKVYVDKKWELVYQGGPNDVYLDTGPSSASEVAIFGASGCGKSTLINAITESNVANMACGVGGVRSIDFYQAPDKKLWRDAWADGPTKYPAATRISRTHWGGMLVDLPGYTARDIRPDAVDSFHQCMSQYYEGTRRQLKGTFFCIDATQGFTISDRKWLRMIPDLHTRVSLTTLVITKSDLVPHERLCNLMRQIYRELTGKDKKRYDSKINFPIIPVSSVYGWGIEQLRGYLVTQCELVPWWKRVEEQREIVEKMKRGSDGDTRAFLGSRVKLVEKLKQIDEWNDAVTESVNAAEYGDQDVAREAEHALVRLDKKQEEVGMHLSGMGARYNPLIKNKYLHSTVRGGAPLGPGISPTTIDEYVASVSTVAKRQDMVDKRRVVGLNDTMYPAATDEPGDFVAKLEALHEEATSYPTAQAVAQRDFLRRKTGEWGDARAGVSMFHPSYMTDPDITKEEWDSLSTEEIEAKIVRSPDQGAGSQARAGKTEADVIEEMRYGFTLADIRKDILGDGDADADANADAGAAVVVQAADDSAAAGVATPAAVDPVADAEPVVYDVASVDVSAVAVDEDTPAAAAAAAAPHAAEVSDVGVDVGAPTTTTATVKVAAAAAAAGEVEVEVEEVREEVSVGFGWVLPPMRDFSDTFQPRVLLDIRRHSAAHPEQSYAAPLWSQQAEEDEGTGAAAPAPPTAAAQAAAAQAALLQSLSEKVLAEAAAGYVAVDNRKTPLRRVGRRSSVATLDDDDAAAAAASVAASNAATAQALRMHRKAGDGRGEEGDEGGAANGSAALEEVLLPRQGRGRLAAELEGSSDAAYDEAARLGVGLEKPDQTQFRAGGGRAKKGADPLPHHTTAGLRPSQKWSSFTQLLNQVPSEVLKAAQPVDRHTAVYKPFFSEPTTGRAVKLDDGLGKNNEPMVLDDDLIEKEVKQKQMGPHYMGYALCCCVCLPGGGKGKET